jgi:glycosyltransferase involved in cell wall biosynthesis
VIGRVAVDRGDLARSRQFVFPGPQPYESLADWARAFDVAIIPFRQSQLVKCVNPLKLREYLATGKPVVSSWMPEVERFSSHIGIARTPEEFLAAIDDALANDSSEKRAERMRLVAGMTWDARMREVMQVVEGQMARARGEKSQSGGRNGAAEALSGASR